MWRGGRKALCSVKIEIEKEAKQPTEVCTAEQVWMKNKPIVIIALCFWSGFFMIIVLTLFFLLHYTYLHCMRVCVCVFFY